MRKANPVNEPEQVLPLAENLMAHLAKGREWATPGVQTALQRAVAGLDTGIETASPRLQAVVRRLADELAGGVETLTPRVQERLKRVGPHAAADIVDPGPVKAARPASLVAWLIPAVLALAGFGVWRSLRKAHEEPVSSAPGQDSGGEDFNADPDLAAGRI
ncbi:hypothetical protein [Arthrobacter sp. ZGTC412]|uniref:hypothetical protein n=1 Tax=Arthrobacter sp. ZGTC412 TaxID=2058900 RepID=UPI000CE30330|nr:hypothetical protein [Arthrobacter sp. ZGTC412]